MFSGLMMLAMTLVTPASQAQQMPLDPLNRMHAGVAVIDDLNLGATVGLDSRLTRLVYVDVGAFISPTALPQAEVDPDGDPASWFVLRHALFVTPGFRVPHRYRQGLNWDLMGRVGFAAVWSIDTSIEYDALADPALLGGADLILRKDKLGVRISGKAAYYRSWSMDAREELVIIRPLAALEGFYQW